MITTIRTKDVVIIKIPGAIVASVKTAMTCRVEATCSGFSAVPTSTLTLGIIGADSAQLVKSTPTTQIKNQLRFKPNHTSQERILIASVRLAVIFLHEYVRLHDLLRRQFHHIGSRKGKSTRESPKQNHD